MPLYLVATPIGNLEDVTLRALRVLREADLLLAEDTRHTRRLLERHAIEAKPRSLHAHNEASRIAKVLAVLAEGGSVALVSDAGTPLVSDPGARLVQAAVLAGHDTVPVPGPSAPLAALVASGLPCERWSFVGFLPRKAGARDPLLADLAARKDTLVFFESPRRLAATLSNLLETLGDRPACVARELTKRHEELARGSLSELAERFAGGARGEVTLVVAGAPPGAAVSTDADLDAAIGAGLEAGRPSRDLASELAKRHGRPRREVYTRILALREEGRLGRQG
jgi:16S rRNA (cytidine1402-2'-O)-methyltransferase